MATKRAIICGHLGLSGENRVWIPVDRIIAIHATQEDRRIYWGNTTVWLDNGTNEPTTIHLVEQPEEIVSLAEGA